MIRASGPGESAGLASLEGIRQTVAVGNPELYRHVALYLQVLRSVLPGRVEQACFHLATQVHADRYLSLPQGSRLELQSQVRQKVQRCCSLLTVEQLVALAARLDQERQQQQSRRQQKLLKRLLGQSEDGDPVAGEGESNPESDPAQPGETPPPLPPGSVRLDLSPPLDQRALGWSLSPLWGGVGPMRDGQEDLDDPFDADGFDDELDATGDDPDSPEAGSEGQEPATNAAQAGRRSGDDPEAAQAAALMAALMQGLLQGEADPEEGVAPEGEEEDGTEAGVDGESAALSAGRMAAIGGLNQTAGLSPRQEGASGGRGMSAGVVPLLPMAPAGGDGASAADSPWSQATLPQDPIQLLRWLEGLELALARRLRNLSHALNLELLRHGLSRGLLPTSLLEATLQGQIETLSSPSNVLRLQLPFGLSPGAPPLQAVAILLRTTDLEMEEPRLRTCRRRIHQHRQQLRKMAQTYRRLQRRQRAHEAERLWLQDVRASRKTES